MKLIKTFIWLSFFMVCVQASAVETVLTQYERDIDHEIVRVIGENKKTHALIVVAKTYLSRRKAAVNPNRSKYEVYEIIETGRKGRVPLLTVPVGENLVVGKAAWVDDGYVIPVIRKSKIVEAYKYKPSSGLVVENVFPDIDIKNKNVQAIYAVSQGYILVYPSGASLVLIYYSNKSKAQYVLPLLAKKEVVLSIDDVIEHEGVVHITGIGVGEINSENIYVWIYSFHPESQEGKGTSFVLKAKGERMQPRFIPTLHSSPSILLSTRASGNKPPKVSIFSFNGGYDLNIMSSSNFNKMSSATMQVLLIKSDNKFKRVVFIDNKGEKKEYTLNYNQVNDLEKLLSGKNASRIDSENKDKIIAKVASSVGHILNGRQKNVWNKNTYNGQGDKNFTVVGICKGRFLFLEKNTKKQPFQQFLDFMLISDEGKEESLYMDSKRTKDPYIEVMAHPVNSFLYTIVNFSKFEEIRRPEGWYSWISYRIDKYNVETICKAHKSEQN